jgi:hypothetical protein
MHPWRCAPSRQAGSFAPSRYARSLPEGLRSPSGGRAEGSRYFHVCNQRHVIRTLYPFDALRHSHVVDFEAAHINAI